MYKENEKLKLIQDYEVKGEIIKAGTEVTFIRAFDIGTSSILVVSHDCESVNINELLLTPVETDTIDELKKFNDLLIKSNPELGVYHHNIIVRSFYKVKAFILNVFILPVKNFLTRNSKPAKIEHDLSDLKDMMNQDNSGGFDD